MEVRAKAKRKSELMMLTIVVTTLPKRYMRAVRPIKISIIVERTAAM